MCTVCEHQSVIEEPSETDKFYNVNVAYSVKAKSQEEAWAKVINLMGSPESNKFTEVEEPTLLTGLEEEDFEYLIS